jgi:hypothetical protein
MSITDKFWSKITKLAASIKRIRNMVKINADNQGWRVKDIFKYFVSSPILLVLRYEQIKSNLGATTPVEGKSLDGTSLKVLEKTVEEISSGT